MGLKKGVQDLRIYMEQQLLHESKLPKIMVVLFWNSATSQIETSLLIRKEI